MLILFDSFHFFRGIYGIPVRQKYSGNVCISDNFPAVSRYKNSSKDRSYSFKKVGKADVETRKKKDTRKISFFCNLNERVTEVL